MKSIAKQVIRFLREEDGPTAVEYAMMLLLVFLACLTSVVMLGQTTAANFEQSNTAIEEALDNRP